jgi:hypothetical protein
MVDADVIDVITERNLFLQKKQKKTLVNKIAASEK